MKIEWSSEYELGIDVIDGQHRRIVEYINQVHESEQHSGDAALNEVMTNLVDYTLSHFAFEEAMMEDAGYRDLAAHKITHKTFARQIELIKARYDKGDDVAVELSDVLLEWLLQHIMTDDQSYTPVVKEKLLEIPTQDHKNWVRKATVRFFS